MVGPIIQFLDACNNTHVQILSTNIKYNNTHVQLKYIYVQIFILCLRYIFVYVYLKIKHSCVSKIKHIYINVSEEYLD